MNIKNRFISSHQARKNIRVRSVWYFTAACLQFANAYRFLPTYTVSIFSMNCAYELTQTKMSCCSVAVELCVKLVIFAAHVNSLSVEVYGIPEFSFPVFLVAFLKVHFRYC